MRISDEKVLAALLENGSIRKAAAALGCSAGCVRDRLRDEQFKNRFEEAKAAALNEATDCMKIRVSSAVDTLSAVMEDTDNPATVRTSAADSLLRHTLRYIEQADILRRLAALEAAREGDE